jgi:SlyX protein
MNAMSELKTLDERIDFLETKLTFLDNTIETLNTTITEQWLKIDALSRQLASLTSACRKRRRARPVRPTSLHRIIRNESTVGSSQLWGSQRSASPKNNRTVSRS